LIRIATLSLRIGWAEHRNNVNLTLTSQVFIDAGAAILYLVNFALVARIVRSHHPQIAGTVFKGVRLGLFFLTLMSVALIMIANIQMAYTLTGKTIHTDRNILVFGATFNAGIAFLPVPVVLLSLLSSHQPDSTSIMASSDRRRTALVMASSLLLTFRAGWICVSSWQDPVAPTGPTQWYLAKPVFYLVSLLPELVVVYLLALGRMDRFFFLDPHGAFVDPAPSQPSSNPGSSPGPTASYLENPELKRAWGVSPTSDEEANAPGKNVQYAHEYSVVNGQRRMPINLAPIQDRKFGGRYKSHESLMQPYFNQSMDTLHEGYPLPSDHDNFPLPAGTAAPLQPQPPPPAAPPRGPRLSLVTSFRDSYAQALHHPRQSLAVDPSTGQWYLTAGAPAGATNGGSNPHLSMAYADAPSVYYDDGYGRPASVLTLVPAMPYHHHAAAYGYGAPPPAAYLPGMQVPVSVSAAAHAYPGVQTPPAAHAYPATPHPHRPAGPRRQSTASLGHHGADGRRRSNSVGDITAAASSSSGTSPPLGGRAAAAAARAARAERAERAAESNSRRGSVAGVGRKQVSFASSAGAATNSTSGLSSLAALADAANRASELANGGEGGDGGEGSGWWKGINESVSPV
jgi:hypothetical protein